MQLRYALWMLSKDTASARAYIEDQEKTKNLGYAVAALADLDDKASRDAIATRAPWLRNAVAREVFAEGLQRLDTQTWPPPAPSRMIWMFGRKSSTERALGEDSDNVFVQRAMARKADPELGIVYEADNSAEDD
jgi:hypothetical protein